MKHYKSDGILSVLTVSIPPHKPKALLQKSKAPLLKTFWQRLWWEQSGKVTRLKTSLQK